MLTTGYGFHLEDYITTASVIAGQKVGWPLGSVLYEINNLPWTYEGDAVTKGMGVSLVIFLAFLLACCVALAGKLYRAHSNKEGWSEWKLGPDGGGNYGAVGEGFQIEDINNA